MSSSTSSSSPKLVSDLVSFLDRSPSPFHAVSSTTSLLSAAGFQRVSEQDTWSPLIKAGAKLFFTRNDSSIVAFAIGNRWKPGNGFVIQAAHTDSPVLRVKPVSRVSKSGFQSVGVEPYGGGLWHTWFDRDLSVAGRVIIKDTSVSSASSSASSVFHTRLVHIRRPILRIPMLAIHLQRDISEKGFQPNKQTHLLPILATNVQAALNATNTASTATTANNTSAASSTTTSATSGSGSALDAHHSALVSLIANELNVQPQQIVDFELVLCDTQAPAIGGAFSEFILSGRLDNLCMSYLCVRSLIDSCSSLNDESMIRMAALFDNEEVGSESMAGAASNLMISLLTRINGVDTVNEAVARSLLVSADMAHAVHPNYSEVHEENHRPEFHGGLVIKYNGNQRYATNVMTAFPVSQIAAAHKIRVQKFCVRNDSLCGSTIGPILAANTGMRTVDVGVPQLSMHSIREMAATTDVEQAHQLLLHIFNDFGNFDANFKQSAIIVDP